MNVKSSYALPVTFMAGAAIGPTLLTTALRAQGTPPAYVVAEVAIHDAETFARGYAPKVGGTVQSFGGRFLTSGKLTALEGKLPPRFVIIAFNSMEKARAWYESPEYKPLLETRKKTATSTLFIAEGLPR